MFGNSSKTNFKGYNNYYNGVAGGVVRTRVDRLYANGFLVLNLSKLFPQSIAKVELPIFKRNSVSFIFRILKLPSLRNANGHYLVICFFYYPRTLLEIFKMRPLSCPRRNN